MDRETLKLCQILLEDIDELEEFIEVLENQYVNHITGSTWIGDCEKRHSYILKGELRDKVIDYLKNKLNLMEEEFKRV